MSLEYLKATLIGIVAVLAPIHTMMITVLVLLSADTLTGIWAAIKRNEGINSAGLRRTITKAVMYMLALICGFICQKYLLADILPVVNIIASAVGVVELKSILENADSITGGSLFKSLIEKLGSVNDKKD